MNEAGDNLGEAGDNMGEAGDNMGEAGDNMGEAGDSMTSGIMYVHVSSSSRWISSLFILLNPEKDGEKKKLNRDNFYRKFLWENIVTEYQLYALNSGWHLWNVI
jgi:hypothetical protein